MRILLTGATGTIGSAVLDELRSAGHEVVAIVRSERSAARVTAHGATAVEGDLRDADWLASTLADVDAAIHTAAPESDAASFDGAVVDAVVSAFAGDGRRFVHTSGIWIHGSGDALDESSPLVPPALVAWRVPIEERLLGSSVSATIVAPGVVYGGAGGGIPALVTTPDDDGLLRLVGDGRQHWSLVHVRDLARLYRILVEHDDALGRVIAVDGAPVTVRALAEAALASGASASGRAATGIVEETADASRARLSGPFADALLLDQRASGEKARSVGWRPDHASVLDEFEPTDASEQPAA